ncbi:MAG TPA: Ig-like domain-containing protein, partial [Nocardioides sp.]|nr:Ig-like domain-containing protein [Nocardioides sp.]
MDDSRARKYQLSKVLAVLVTAALAAVLAIASPAAADTTVTTTDLTSDLNPSTYGDAITLTATVTGDAPTGSVTFTDGATTLDVVALVGGVAVLVTDELTAGDHTIVATYGGDLGNDPSTSTGLVQSVESVETATNLDSDANPSQYGDSVTLTATVIGGDPTGTVSFDDGATHLGDGTVTDGEATLTTSTLSVGDHTITATYAGDANHDGSTSNNLVQTVAVVGTTTLLESSANPSDFGEAVTFTATVLGDSPTGSVSFDDGATHLGDGTVTDGEATLTTSALSVGSHTVTATYSGDTNNDMSVSAELVQSVGVVGTTTTVVSDANPSVLGDLVTFTATVTGADPTGTVTFTDGATVLGSAPVDGSGEASLETSTLAVGAHTITATYSGDDNNGVSSDDLVQTVDKLGTATTLASSLNPSTTADSVTLTATVTGGPTPTGSVTFKDGATVLGSANLNGSGVATLGAGPFTAGAHSLTATYGGDANHVGSSGSLTQ